MAKCTMCDKGWADDLIEADGICKECHSEHRLPLPSEPIRPRVPCAKCGATKLVRCLAIRERAATGGDYVSEYIAELAATFEVDKSITFWAGRDVEKPDPGKPLGRFEAYICRECGYTELYTRNPKEIPIGPHYATEEFDVGTDGPYR